MRSKSFQALAPLFTITALLALPWACGKNLAPASVPAQPVTVQGGVPGRDWYPTTLDGFPGRGGHTALNFNGRMWVIGGQNYGPLLNDVWSSPDGLNWSAATTQAAFPARVQHSSVVFNNKMWVIGGTTNTGYNGGQNDVWSSPDGASWSAATTQAAFSARILQASVTFNNKMWVIGGLNVSNAPLTDVWSSTDGGNWSATTTQAAFPPRWGHSAVVYNNKMWILGGYNTTFLNDVWYSTDGVSWNQAPFVSSVAFPARMNHASTVFDGVMWVIGGFNGSVDLNDAWYSSDGTVWYEASATVPFPARSELGLVTFNNLMWVLGGASSGYEGDAWYSP